MVNVKDLLKKYKETESFVDTTLARIKAYEILLTTNELEDTITITIPTSNNLGMPKSKYNKKSIVELEVLKKLQEKKITAQEIKDLIAEERSKVFIPQMEIQQINIAMSKLTMRERYILECKYFEKMTWWQIEYAHNEKFRNNQLTCDMLQKNCKKSLEDLTLILTPFMDKWSNY